MKNNRVRYLSESAVCIAAATVLNMITVIRMPFGGSVTAASMLPLLLVSYRYGVKKGMLTGFVFSVISLMFDGSVLSFATSRTAVAAIIFLDYIFAFSSVAFGGIFKGKLSSQRTELILGTLIFSAVRYIFHVISGCTVWAGVSIPSSDGLIYSLVYNSAYMLPETAVLIAAVFYLTGIISFDGEKLARTSVAGNKQGNIFKNIAVFMMLAVILFDMLTAFSYIQTEKGYSIENIVNAPFGLIIIVTVAGAVVSGILFILAKHKEKPSK